MRKLLNTLYVTSPDSYLKRDGMNVVITKDGTEVFRIPVINIEGIVMFGYMGATPELMKLCVDNNVSLTFMSPQGSFLSCVQGPTKGNVLLRKKQYKLNEDVDFSLQLSILFIAGKIQNYRNIIRRAIRDNGSNERLELVSKKLERSKDRAMSVTTPNELLGIEGDAANEYFSVFNELILKQKDHFMFNGRSRRPPRDMVNVLLSFVYTLIVNDMKAALEGVGLDPYVGFFHTIRPGKPSLALDMMEELRAYLGDRLVLSMINRQQITVKDFIHQNDDILLLTDEGRKKVLTAWQERKKEEITHPYLQAKMQIGLLPHVQSKLLVSFLRGDINNYPVFLIK